MPIVDSDWWIEMLSFRDKQGAEDADRGSFSPPYPGSEDPQDTDENAAYRSGFDRRRKELGASFCWA
jgi:hypothetical protein